jgi:hypothetical protein
VASAVKLVDLTPGLLPGHSACQVSRNSRQPRAKAVAMVVNVWSMPQNMPADAPTNGVVGFPESRVLGPSLLRLRKSFRNAGR